MPRKFCPRGSVGGTKKLRAIGTLSTLHSLSPWHQLRRQDMSDPSTSTAPAEQEQVGRNCDAIAAADARTQAFRDIYHAAAAFTTLPCHTSQHVDPWNVTGGTDGKIDYNKLVEQVSRTRGRTASRQDFHAPAWYDVSTCTCSFAAVRLLQAG